jgi:hypothetical protein
MTNALKIKDMTPEQRKEYQNAACKKFYLKNRDAVIEKTKKYYHENKEKMLPKVREYYWDHRDEYLETASIKRELKKMIQN